MTNEELIRAARICTNGGNCEDCPSNANAEHDCVDVVLQGLADALEQATKERDTLLNDLIEAADNCKQDGVFGVCFCCKKRNSCYYLWSSSEDMECEFEWRGAQE